MNHPIHGRPVRCSSLPDAAPHRLASVQAAALQSRARRFQGDVLLRPVALLALAGLAGGFLGGCHKGSPGGSASNLPQGSAAQHPGQEPGGGLVFLVEPNDGGQRSSLHVRSIRWGRLAEIRDQDGVLRFQDYVISETAQSGNDYLIEDNPVSEKTTVTIRHPYDPAPNSPFVTFVRQLEDNLTQVADKSLNPSELPPFPLVPRNAAIVIDFDDLLDPSKISADTIRVLRGYPPEFPFDARIIPDPSHGDLADFDGQPGLEFYSTRVIVDATVSSLEAAQTDPPLPVNSVGLPASVTPALPNIVVRIPTVRAPEFGQFTILTNPTNHALASSGNGSIDFASPTRDLVRALRSGGSSSVTGDAHNGFLADMVPPSVLGTQAATITNVAPGPTPQTFLCDLDFLLGPCANRLLAGDVIQQGGVFAEVICPPFQTCQPNTEVTGDLVGTIVENVYFRIIAADPTGPQTIGPGPGQISMRYHAGVPSGKAPCFVRFSLIGLPPDRNVSPSTAVFVRFTEPMDPLAVQPFDTLLVLRKDPNVTPLLTAYDFVVSGITAAPDLREFTVQPVLPLKHGAGLMESYFLHILGGPDGPTDLAGNALATAVPAVTFRLDPSAAVQNTDGFAIRFGSTDEIAGIGPTGTQGVDLPEWRGQFLLDPDREVMKSRPVTHFTAAADRTQAVPSLMAAFAGGVQTPLSKYGSKLHALWRYCDVGFGLLDEVNFNVDVEGLAWSPASGSVNPDHYTRFEMSVAHGKFLPDESLNPALLPSWPLSGVTSTYTNNQADPILDPLRTVYPVAGGPTGYTVTSTDLFQGPTGTNFFPWPMNRNVPAALKTYYTWRDTALLNKAGPNGPGAELEIVVAATGTGVQGQPFAANAIPTVGLPLLMEFRCYPDGGASGLNGFDISIATASSPQPYFRAFSTGGIGTNLMPNEVQPDSWTTATGGFNPTSTPNPGAITPALDNVFYIGQLDLVTRISRVHSIWFNATIDNIAPTQYGTPIVEPRPQDQPEGTRIDLHFRGASQVVLPALATDASALDAYGNRIPAGADPLFFPTGPNAATWKSSLSALNGAALFQVRMTFVSNAQTNLNPEISALGFSYRR